MTAFVHAPYPAFLRLATVPALEICLNKSAVCEDFALRICSLPKAAAKPTGAENREGFTPELCTGEGIYLNKKNGFPFFFDLRC